MEDILNKNMEEKVKEETKRTWYVTHDARTWEEFLKWGVESAGPTFTMEIRSTDKDGKEELSFTFEISGDYYCCGSQNFEDVKTKFVSHKISNNMTTEEVCELIEKEERDKNLPKLIQESIKNTLIQMDPSEFLEQIWDQL